jgi:hypothetical protein
LENKIIVGLVGVLLIGGAIFAFSDNSKMSAENTDKPSKRGATKKAGIQLVTAKQAWAEIKPEADEWSENYRIARVSDISSPSYQRIDGLSLGWEFYLEQCEEYFGGSSTDLCKEGKTKTFYYQTTDVVGRPAGVSADQESTMTSGRRTFNAGKWKIDSDQAQDFAREAEGRERNENEEFEMAIEVTDGTPYWEVVRKCWFKGDRENCDSSNGYAAYVNIESGEATAEKP